MSYFKYPPQCLAWCQQSEFIDLFLSRFQEKCAEVTQGLVSQV